MKTFFKIILMSTLFFFGNMTAQTIGDFKPDTYKYGLNKVKKANKRVYIKGFNVNFEVYKEAIDVKTGGQGFRNTRTSDATARAAVGIGGVDAADVQMQTNKLYNEFVAMLEAKGLEIITIEEAEKTDTYQGWEKATGPYVIESGLPGVLTSVPEGFSFMYPGETNSGKKKKGFLGGSFKAQNLSKQLGDVIVADVNLYVMFSEDKEDLFKGRAAKVKILTNLRMVGNYVVSAPKKGGFIKIKGAQSSDRISSNVTFTYGKIGAGALTQYVGSLKKPLEINGVMKKEKVVAFQKQGSSTPTSFSGYSYSNLADRFSNTAKWIDVDSKNYSEGLYLAASKMIKEHTEKYLSNL